MKIKNESKKSIVELYQNQVQEAIDKIISLEIKPSKDMKAYISILEENIKRAPYVLGYLEHAEVKKKK